ncbi:hypothetical protein BDR22DRAFT_811597 [Usnea florida]
MASQSSWRGQARIKGYTKLQRMAMLTFSLIGLQQCANISCSDFEPHLLQLGLAKSQTSLVWIAPPLSGLIVQPMIGVMSDSSQSRWGRRRPFMLLFAILVAFFLVILAWASEIVGVFTSDETVMRRVTVALAVLCIYAVDFAINGVQATCRSLIVDTLPESQQQLGSAWAGRMLGLGHVLGYLVGTIDLSKYLGTHLGGTQFKQICIIAGSSLIFCVGVTCFCVEERNSGFTLLNVRRALRTKTGALAIITTISRTILHLPRKIRAVCWITFWSWFGWSPFFVYGTTWVGETYYRQNADNAANLQSSGDIVGEIARKGSLALVLFSLISFASSIFLPVLISLPSDDIAQHPTQTASQPLSHIRSLIQRYQIDITTAWAVSQFLFAASMIMAPFSTSFQFATTLIALCGASWAMYGWAPLAIMGEEINKLNPTAPSPLNARDASPPSPPASLPTTPSLPSSSDTMAGIYLGIHNIFATIPQFLATFLSTLIFSILEPGPSPELTSPSSAPSTHASNTGGSMDKNAHALSGTAVCLAIGAVFQLVAAWQSLRMRRW